ncbi:MAG: GNAT family N-acetyltransferase [Anaerolineales bacterium]|nr:GNAT family N-acetyltransferase [Anaerolineales bacterium]
MNAKKLGNGLILRRSTAADADLLADFNAQIHGDDELDRIRLAAWTRDLLAKPHPTFHADDFTVVAEVETGRIVSTLNLISQTWTYAGIPFGVGRPELVGTLPEYRNRGLVRTQFDEIHKWSAERGELAQAITGIPYYYRLFGYEMALDLSGRRLGYETHVPKLKEGEKEKFIIRPAVNDDLQFVVELYAEAQKRYTLSCVRAMDIFEYELNVQSRDNIGHKDILIIENEQGERLGYFQHPDFLGMTGIVVFGYELKPGTSWLAVTPSVVRYLWQRGQEFAKRDHRTSTSFCFLLGSDHPVYQALGNALPVVNEPYAWYIRVPDLPAFIHHVTPALEKRLEDSIAVGYSGELKISFYKDGLRLAFEKGKLKEVESWKPESGDDGSAAFPGLTFIQLLFGYRSFEELHHAFADCFWEDNEARVVLKILFPKRLSDVFPVA